jgi:MOSC domain-containing protein YiiM
MQLISVNVGQEQVLQHALKTGRTGIYKFPSEKPVQLTREGLAGDFIANLKSHGGVDQAVYLYGSADYAWWAEALGKPLVPGAFGENLTISELESARVSVGDRLLLGNVILEVTAPRIPCSTLAARMDDAEFVERFQNAERPGVYCRVIREGFLQAGMLVTLEAYAGEKVTLLELFRTAYEPQPALAVLERQLKAPISIRERARKEAQLKKLTGVGG